MYGEYEKTILYSGIYFYLDILISWAFNTPLKQDMIFHHILAVLLCGYSMSMRTFEGHAYTGLTRALIHMEFTNPFLHTILLLRNEYPNFWKENTAIQFLLKIALGIVWVKYRLFSLFMAILNTNVHSSAYVFYICAYLLLLLQLHWFVKMLLA